ncbi:hypothetical protein M9H77_23553 [Catharanthus roseus]|uniref:Uncharacterized protein n=1 Tax=Catharanthus roseus TaxID=4058 RepID=A0ACC0AV52_CATRO|nr:hypothetical protein M9H77_23553 [Catharanthus roseus]
MSEKRNIRDHKRRLLAAQYELRQKQSKAFCKDSSFPSDIRDKHRYKLSKFPRKSSFARVRNRCTFTGRPRSVYEFFRISHIRRQQCGIHNFILIIIATKVKISTERPITLSASQAHFLPPFPCFKDKKSFSFNYDIRSHGGTTGKLASLGLFFKFSPHSTRFHCSYYNQPLFTPSCPHGRSLCGDSISHGSSLGQGPVAFTYLLARFGLRSVKRSNLYLSRWVVTELSLVDLAP